MVVQWIVEADGRVTLERIERTDEAKARRTDPFDKTIREWVARLRYQPEELAGKAVRTRIEVPVTFTMGGARSAGALKKELLENATQSPECRMAASKMVEGLHPVSVDSPFKLLTSG